MNQTEPSICIPYVFSDVKWFTIKNTFEKLLGKNSIKHVTMIKKYNEKGEMYYRVFIHFNKWMDDSRTQNIRKRLLDGISIKVVYDEHLFWKCSASRVNNNNNLHP